MIKKIKYIFLLTIIFTIGIYTKSFARITTNDPTVNSGETVTITINSQEPVASGGIKLTSNEGLTFKSVSGGITNGTLVAFSKSNNVTSGIATYTFIAPQVTENKVYKLQFTSQDMGDENGNPVNSSTATATVTVKAKTNSGTNQSGNTSSSNGSSNSSNSSGKENTKASITKVVINGITVKKDLPVTNKDSVTVNVTTSNGEGLKIYNSLTKKTINADSGKVVTVPIMEGTNTLTITSNSGATATRKIYSQKEEETPGNFIEEPKEEIKVLLKSLSIKSVKSEEEEAINFKLTPEFSSEVYEYSIIIPQEYNDITKLDIKAIGAQEDFTVEITGNEKLVDGENIVTILVKSKDGEKSATYKIIVNKEPKAIEAVAEPVEEVPETIPEEENDSRTIIKIAIVAFTAIVAILGIIFAVVEYMYGKKHNNEEEIGTIPYSSIGFEKEEKGKEDILEDLRKDDKDVQEDEKPKRRGKHF